MYVYIYIFSDLLRKRDSFLRDFSLKKGSIRSYKGAWERFRELHVARTLRVGEVDLSYSPTAPMAQGVFLKDSKKDSFSTGTTRGALVRDDGGRGQRAFQNLCDYLGVRRWGSKQEFIFRDEEGENLSAAISYSTVRTDLLVACELAGVNLEKIGWHSVRKMAAAQEEERVGGDLARVASFLGHSEGSRSTVVYVKPRTKGHGGAIGGKKPRGSSRE